jgi:hypothetical protein
MLRDEKVLEEFVKNIIMQKDDILKRFLNEIEN